MIKFIKKKIKNHKDSKRILNIIKDLKTLKADSYCKGYLCSTCISTFHFNSKKSNKNKLFICIKCNIVTRCVFETGEDLEIFSLYNTAFNSNKDYAELNLDNEKYACSKCNCTVILMSPVISLLRNIDIYEDTKK